MTSATLALHTESIGSAQSVLALLKEPEDDLKALALEQLNGIVDLHWTEVAEFLPSLETLSEDDGFEKKEVAALVASKVFYHLAELDDALTYALAAGSLFDVRQSSEYVDTMVSKAIDEYIKVRSSGDDTQIDPRLEEIVNKMFERCFTSLRFKQALGIALECHRLDMVERAILDSRNVTELLPFCFRLCNRQVRNRSFRQKVLGVLVKLHEKTGHQYDLRLAQCHMLLNNAENVAKMLQELVESSDLGHNLTAYQMAFDLVDDASQEFLLRILETLPKPQPPTPVAAPTTSDDIPMTEEGAEEKQEVKQEPQPQETNEQREAREKLTRLREILAGLPTVQHRIDFLHRECKSDMQILKNIRTNVETRSSALYTAVALCNAIMHAGTTNDTFLRNNMDWLRQAQNWAKFGAIGSLGLIRQGQIKDAMTLLKDFLPAESGPQSGGPAYQEGGALYALGLINAERGSEVVPYLLNCLRSATQNDVVEHGACLGLGLAAFATQKEDVFDEIKSALFMDNTVTGEAAGIALGLVMCGSGNQAAIDEMLQYAHETQREKIIRSLALGVALIMYRREEGANKLIETMSSDKDHLIRYGAMYLIGLAYVATANNWAIRRLLHIAVSDVSDDVRRAAVTALGFVLASEHEECPKVVSLLAESFNPHVRYGAAMAVGISCAGTGLQSAIDLLKPMTKDPVDYVRQAAHIALAMVLIQMSESQNPVVKEVRQNLQQVVSDKHEEMLAKLGALLAIGIIDVGGRNATISLISDSGFTKMGACVGMAMFTQFWFWFPFASFIGLAIKPTAIIAITENLSCANVSFKSNAPPSTFAYPPPVTVQQVQVKKGAKAVLSTTRKQVAKGKVKDERKEDEAKDVEMKEEAAAADAEKEKEPEFQLLHNPARVTVLQQAKIEYLSDQRYVPVNPVKVNGIVVVRDTRPEEKEDIVEASLKPAVAVPAREEDEQEADCPEPFRWP